MCEGRVLQALSRLCPERPVGTLLRSGFLGRGRGHPDTGTSLSPFRAVSVMPVFRADMSLFHQSGTSGPPGAVVKCHPEPPTERCQPCAGLHHQILKHLSVILVLPPTVMPMGYSLNVLFKNCHITSKQVVMMQMDFFSVLIFYFLNKDQF